MTYDWTWYVAGVQQAAGAGVCSLPAEVHGHRLEQHDALNHVGMYTVVKQVGRLSVTRLIRDGVSYWLKYAHSVLDTHSF